MTKLCLNLCPNYSITYDYHKASTNTEARNETKRKEYITLLYIILKKIK